MSFDLYLAGGKAKTPDDLIIKRSCDVLFSQINDRKDIQKFLELMNNNKLFIDSGAYSAWSKNKHIDVDDYIKFINGLKISKNCDNIGQEWRNQYVKRKINGRFKKFNENKK